MKITVLNQLHDPSRAEWVARWLSTLRETRTACTEQMRALQQQELREHTTQAREAAILRMATPGTKELKRWLGGTVEPVSLHFLKIKHPDTQEVAFPNKEVQLVSHRDRRSNLSW